MVDRVSPSIDRYIYISIYVNMLLLLIFFLISLNNITVEGQDMWSVIFPPPIDRYIYIFIYVNIILLFFFVFFR